MNMSTALFTVDHCSITNSLHKCSIVEVLHAPGIVLGRLGGLSGLSGLSRGLTVHSGLKVILVK